MNNHALGGIRNHDPINQTVYALHRLIIGIG
jgi:hypothetical protein